PPWRMAARRATGLWKSATKCRTLFRIEEIGSISSSESRSFAASARCGSANPQQEGDELLDDERCPPYPYTPTFAQSARRRCALYFGASLEWECEGGRVAELCASRNDTIACTSAPPRPTLGMRACWYLSLSTFAMGSPEASTWSGTWM